MKEQENVQSKIRISKINLFIIAIFLSININAQIEKLNIGSQINFNLNTYGIINQLLSDKLIYIIRIDTTTKVFPSIVYKPKALNIDSACIKFNKENFSSISLHFSDSCLFAMTKVFCYENFKITKGSINNKKQLYLGKKYNVTIYETKGINYPKFNIWISSKKNRIKI